MRRTWVTALALVAGACSAQASPTPGPGSAVAPSPGPTISRPVPTASPSASVSLATPSPAASPEAEWVRIAEDYAQRAGFEIASEIRPIVSDEEPDFDSTVLHRVSLGLVVPGGAVIDDDSGWPTLNIYLDDSGAVRVVEAGDDDRPDGPTASAADAVRAANRYLGQVGVDLAEGTIHVAAGEPGRHWYLTLDRQVAGYRVVNAPMGWWLTGDKAYVELRPDGSLARLYAIQPEHEPVPGLLDTAILDERLAKVAQVSGSKLTTFEREFLFVRAQDRESGAESVVLSLAYCATHRFGYGWESWCVDAGTGEFSTMGGGVD